MIGEGPAPDRLHQDIMPGIVGDWRQLRGRAIAEPLGLDTVVPIVVGINEANGGSAAIRGVERPQVDDLLGRSRHEPLCCASPTKILIESGIEIGRPAEREYSLRTERSPVVERAENATRTAKANKPARAK